MPCLEVIVDTVEDAIAAEKGGATQIAILSHYPSTGITPSFGMVVRIREITKIPILILICPHTRSYIPSAEDLNTCLYDIKAFRGLGINDFLLGFIDQSNNLNMQIVKRIQQEFENIHLHSRTLWEFSRDIEKNVETAIELGFLSMRTSGNYAINSLNNSDNSKTIQNLSHIKEIANNRIEILLTGGITETNFETIVRKTNILNLQIGRGVRTPNNSYSPVDSSKVAAIRSKQIKLFEELCINN